MPSGTMCNVAATLVHCRPGDEILAHETAHIVAREGGAHAALGGFQIMPLPAPTGNSRPTRCARRCTRARATSRRRPWSASNRPPISAAARSGRRPRWMRSCKSPRPAGWPPTWTARGCSMPASRPAFPPATWPRAGIPPGSTSPRDWARRSAAAIAGSRDFIDEVWRWKQRLGGSMRQAGICAAACIYALDHHVDRLAEDHANARALARGLSQISGIEVQEPETNLVFFRPDGAGVSGNKMVAELAQARRAARDDGRPDQRLHPSRCHGRDDRGDGRVRAGDRAGGCERSLLQRLIDRASSPPSRSGRAARATAS